jgi:hypothetical protein
MFGVFTAVCERVPDWLAVGNYDRELTMKMKYSKIFYLAFVRHQNPLIVAIGKKVEIFLQDDDLN